MIAGFIYVIINNINGKPYVGQTIHSIDKRWKSHANNARRGGLYPICKAIRKYGVNNFNVIEVAQANTRNELNELEVYYIQLYQSIKPNGYNLDSGGKSYVRHPDTGAKISVAKKGKPSHRKGAKMSDETKEKCRIANSGKPSSRKGKHLSVETREKISLARKGKKGTPHTVEFKEKLSERMMDNKYNKGKSFTDAHKEKIRAASQRRMRGSDGQFKRCENA